MSDLLVSLAFVVQHCQSFARQTLRETGAFQPFGAYVAPHSTKLNLLAAVPERSAANTVEGYALLEKMVRELAAKGTMGAYALAAPANLPQAFESTYQDGIRIHAEAPDFSRLIYTPYRVLPYRAIRHFFLVVPCVEYGEEIVVDTHAKAYAQSAA